MAEADAGFSALVDSFVDTASSLSLDDVRPLAVAGHTNPSNTSQIVNPLIGPPPITLRPAG
jgi:hypothetical protein